MASAMTDLLAAADFARFAASSYFAAGYSLKACAMLGEAMNDDANSRALFAHANSEDRLSFQATQKRAQSTRRLYSEKCQSTN
jgi:hypothetical protein